jgi:restriction endonuclease S subunit
MQSKTMKLKEICSIQMGYSCRKRQKLSDLGVLLIQLKNIGVDGQIKIKELNRISENEIKDTHKVKNGDLIFRSRGSLMRIVKVPDCDETMALAAPLLKVNVDTTRIVPEYLCWYINQPLGQMYLESVVMGSVIKMVGKAVLQEMPVKIPSLEQQKEIVELISLQNREAQLFQEVKDKREKLINTQIMSYLTDVE